MNEFLLEELSWSLRQETINKNRITGKLQRCQLGNFEVGSKKEAKERAKSSYLVELYILSLTS